MLVNIMLSALATLVLAISHASAAFVSLSARRPPLTRCRSDAPQNRNGFEFDTEVTRAAQANRQRVDAAIDPLTAMGLSGLRDSPEEAPVLTSFTMTDESKAGILRQMQAAFDNYPPAEIVQMLDALWDAGPDAPTGRSLQKLLQLTLLADGIEADYMRGGGRYSEQLEDDMRCVRSEIRMYGKDGERLLREAAGDGVGGSWWARLFG